MKCIICGKNTKKTYKFDHGEIFLCSNDCTKKLTFKINGNAVPIAWVDESDLKEQKVFSKKKNKFSVDEIILAGTVIKNYLGDFEPFWTEFQDNCKIACRVIETDRVEKTPEKNLLSLVGTLHFEESQKTLAERLKNMDR